MTAKYKRKRLLTENSLDAKPKHINLEGAERQEAKREITKELVIKDNPSCPKCDNSMGLSGTSELLSEQWLVCQSCDYECEASELNEEEESNG